MANTFDHFDLTSSSVTGKAADLAMLRPHLNITFRDQRSVSVAEAHACVSDACAGHDADEVVTVDYPEKAGAAMLEAVLFVDRLITITNEEVAKMIAKRGSGTSGSDGGAS